MTNLTKGNSPFYPGQPVPVELFVGRREQIDRILTRGAGQVSRGKPVAVFIQGEYGIGKSSLAKFVQWEAEMQFGIHSINASLGGAKTIGDVAQAVLIGATRSGLSENTKWERTKDWLGKYIKEASVAGISFNMEALKQDSLNLTSPLALLSFLEEFAVRIGAPNLCLTLDEINGIAALPEFSGLLKSLVDSNAMSPKPLPLLLILCGTEEKRQEMTRVYESISRVFEVVDITPFSDDETYAFFTKAFDSVGMEVQSGALSFMSHYSAGFPKIMHLIGDATFWLDQDGVIDYKDAVTGTGTAAFDVGQKFVDAQVVNALGSSDYHSILKKLGALGPEIIDGFHKHQLERQLSEPEQKKLNNFLQKMKSLRVLRSGEARGEYLFNSRMVALYIWLRTPKS
jgi:hypothetical protein